MTNIQVAVMNGSTVLKDGDIVPVVAALQMQVQRDFAPAWGFDAQVVFLPKGQKPGTNMWWMVMLDDADQAGALGYHDLTNEGLPLAKVFVKTTMQYREHWSVTASHELLEMLADPDINLTVFDQKTDTSGRLYAYEASDACEGEKYAYEINKVLVSDFVYPEWFESFRKPKSTQFDFTKNITKPFEILPQGYIGIFDVTDGEGWKQLTARGIAERKIEKEEIGSRHEKRERPRGEWRRSSGIFM